MAQLSLILVGAFCVVFIPTVLAMECNIGGFAVSCPTFIDDKDKAFCCESRNFNYCCDIEDYMKTNAGIIAGLVISIVVVILIVTLCCCCFCSCCCLARRRMERGRVLYGPVTTTSVTTTPANFQVIHPPPPSYCPQSYPSQQPPLNPHYK